jgi:hypothetical protein
LVRGVWGGYSAGGGRSGGSRSALRRHRVEPSPKREAWRAPRDRRNNDQLDCPAAAFHDRLPHAMLWRNKGRGRLAAGFFCSGRGCSSCPRSGEAPEPNRCGLERTPRVQRPMLHADASGAAQVAPRVHTAKAHMLLRASHRHQGGNQSTTAGSVSLRYDHALDAGLCPPRAL